MKKGLLVLLLAVAMVAPAFAAKGDMFINGKLGLGVSNSLKMSGAGEMPDDLLMGIKAKNPISLGAEFFYGLMDNLSAGFGVNYTFNSETNINRVKAKIGTTNIYVAVKPEAKIDSDIVSSIYVIGQIGLAMNRCDIDGVEDNMPSIDSGLYLGAGLGTTIKDCIIVELIFSSSNGSASQDGETADVQYTATTINVGYKFAL